MSEHTYAGSLVSNSSMYDGSRKLDVGNVSCTEFVIDILMYQCTMYIIE